MSTDDVDQAIVAAARACVEAGARVLVLTDPNAAPIDRFTCALNEAWAMLPDWRVRPTDAHQSLCGLADKAGIDQKRNGREMRFGASGRASMTDSLKHGLAAIGNREDDYVKFLPFWNGASHAGPDAGLLALAIRGRANLGVEVRGHAAIAALAVYGAAQTQQARYMGYPTVADGFGAAPS